MKLGFQTVLSLAIIVILSVPALSFSDNLDNTCRLSLIPKLKLNAPSVLTQRLPGEQEFPETWAIFDTDQTTAPIWEEGIFIILDNETIISAPRFSDQGNIQTHRGLIRLALSLDRRRTASSIRFTSVGEIHYSQDEVIINNRSGTLKPSSAYLELSQKILQKFFKKNKTIHLEDHSQLTENHPHYVKNSIFDPIHTILYVEKIGKEAFMKALNSTNTELLLAQLVRETSFSQGQQPKRPFRRLSQQGLLDYIQKHGHQVNRTELRERAQEKALLPPRSLSVFNRAINRLGEEAFLFLDEDQFYTFIEKNTSQQDEYDIRVSTIMLTVPVKISEQKVYDVDVYLYPRVFSDQQLVGSEELHNTLIEMLSEHLAPRSFERKYYVNQERSGIRIIKKKNSQLLKVWGLSKSEFRKKLKVNLARPTHTIRMSL